MKVESLQRVCLCQELRPVPRCSAAYSSRPVCSGLIQKNTKLFLYVEHFQDMFICRKVLTCHGLEQVCTVLHVVVSIVAVSSLTQNSALLISCEVFIQSCFKVPSRQAKRVVAVVLFPQQKLSLDQQRGSVPGLSFLGYIIKRQELTMWGLASKSLKSSSWTPAIIL